MDSQIEPLLILQDRDMLRLNLVASLEAIPAENAKAKAQIDAVRQRIEEAKRALQLLQVKRKETASRAESAQEQIIRYKNQQLQVKKNEEYQALTHEIERTQATIAALEDEELTLLMEIDAVEADFAADSAAAGEAIALLEKELGVLGEREANLAAQRGEAEAAAEQAAAAVAPAYLEAYRRVGQRKARQPWVVPLEERRCGGCHLKVSGEQESAVRGEDRPVHCDSCGRVIYWP